MTASRAPGSSRRACAARARAPPCGEAGPRELEGGQRGVRARHQDGHPPGGGQVADYLDRLALARRVEAEELLAAQRGQRGGQRVIAGPAGAATRRPSDRAVAAYRADSARGVSAGSVTGGPCGVRGYHRRGQRGHGRGRGGDACHAAQSHDEPFLSGWTAQEVTDRPCGHCVTLRSRPRAVPPVAGRPARHPGPRRPAGGRTGCTRPLPGRGRQMARRVMKAGRRGPTLRS